ncbi:alkene reductase [Actinoplanes teichomyceticus]|uniref:2,4-dienoyl-CoA reductase-like NADH-dependent reductase (Old Yellow Enzyme family) n=1 Tax=Actinoplanes teichomyceticus TaxID=1867 RepID=A0A561VKX0_ACTTI|nr:alkene reductase [Actinoplanes teichomyceticus]TWG12234.1 2,4-dienoyl-CoA reductase-like NADH-dependent reductase (Old Yellow Enzyme family) [Actinoplanes teichomyceticus]GIF14170.1 alkene reductase [Actinoplanes teichomyceticus]
MTVEKLFTPVTFGSLQLKNRLVMAPLTRIRADEHGVPGDLLVEHYRQRASMGMIITEGTWPVREGRTWIGQPGIETAEQVAGWRRVADAVHAAGGTIVMQIMHGGRISHPAISGTGRTVAPSALAAPGEIRIPDGKAELPVPHALTADEIAGVVAAFVAAARNAIEAGLDGVEVHGANGYLIHEFLSPASNIRTDGYGGSPANRARLAIEVVTAVAAAIGADRTGIRLSPEHNIQGALETDPDDVLATYLALAEGIAPVGPAFVDILHADPAGKLVQGIRQTVGAPVVVNTGFASVTTRDEAVRLVGDDLADATAVGRAAIANPDLVERWTHGHEENTPDPDTFYTGGARGYTDYPTR